MATHITIEQSLLLWVLAEAGLFLIARLFTGSKWSLVISCVIATWMIGLYWQHWLAFVPPVLLVLLVMAAIWGNPFPYGDESGWTFSEEQQATAFAIIQALAPEYDNPYDPIFQQEAWRAYQTEHFDERWAQRQADWQAKVQGLTWRKALRRVPGLVSSFAPFHAPVLVPIQGYRAEELVALSGFSFVRWWRNFWRPGKAGEIEIKHKARLAVRAGVISPDDPRALCILSHENIQTCLERGGPIDVANI